MVFASVRARRVGDSMVMTLPKTILQSVKFEEGELLLLETMRPGFLSVRKERDSMSKLQELKMELSVLKAKLETVDSKVILAKWEYANSMPTEHQGIDDPILYEGTLAGYKLERSEIQLNIAEKELETFRLSGMVFHEGPDNNSASDVARSNGNDVGSTIRAARNAKGYTLQDVSAITGQNSVTIGNWERGKQNPTKESLIRLSEALDLPEEWLS